MKKIVFFILFFFHAVIIHAACSNQYQKIFINEVNTKINFVELYASPAAFNGNYTVKVCSNVKQGNQTSVVCESHPYTINGSTSWYIQNFSNIANLNDFDVTLYDSNNNIVDYIRIGKSPIQSYNFDYINCSSINSNITTSSHTYINNNRGQRDFYRSPDGSTTWNETNWVNNTQGATNGGSSSSCSEFNYYLYHTYDPALVPQDRLNTRISQTDFNLSIDVGCITAGTIPARKITDVYAIGNTDTCTNASILSPLWNSIVGVDLNNTAQTVNLTGLKSTQPFPNIRLMLKTDANEFFCSEDTMSIRPSSFNITSPSSIKASNFNLSVTAQNSGNGYNGTATVNTALQTSNTSCPTTSDFITSTAGNSLVFVNDTNTTQMKATDVGSIHLNLKDSSWTAIDQPNDCIVNSNSNSANSEGKFGCNIENNLSITIIPDHFDVNATLSNANNGTFTYLSTDLTMSANIDVNITAKNSDGNVTKNYTSGCFAKTTSLNLPHSSVPSPLSKILYRDNLNTIDSNISTSSPISLSLDHAKFTQGSALPKVTLNFDRNSSKPLNPFDFNLTSADVNDTDNVIGTTVPTGKATFFYGRARAYDIKTDQPSAPNPIELEVYSTTSSGYVSGMPQNILHWYRNLNHSTLNAGRVIGGGFTVGVSDNTQLNALAAPINGIHPVTVSSTTDQTVHLDISPWLWYSPSMAYNYTTNCTAHPCFNYQYFGTAASTNTGVNSGTFQGSDFTLTPAKKIIKQGVKVFR
jgi:hypothetical protein